MAQITAGYSHRGQFIWADWVALMAGLVFFLFLLLFFLVDFIAAGSAGANHLWQTLGTKGIEINLLVAGFVWVCLRGIDYLAHASARLVRERFRRQPARS
jgi:hypothetical protein